MSGCSSRVREAGWVTAPRLSVGVITADLTRLGMELEILRVKASWAHVDVMDGRYCPQLTGVSVESGSRQASGPKHAHIFL
jgi:pentose-5-phosphate-3-epimerase